MYRKSAVLLPVAVLLWPLLALGGPPRETQDLEPAVDTSQLPPRPAPRDSAPASVAARAGRTRQPHAPRKPAAAEPATAAQAAAHARNMDRLQLDPTRVTGNSELPRIMYVVPWKRAGLGDAAGKPANSLIDEVLEPVDRDVFKRENSYYSALPSQTVPPADSAPQAPGADGPQDEK